VTGDRRIHWLRMVYRAWRRNVYGNPLVTLVLGAGLGWGLTEWLWP
jgi:hypothetical protein